MRVRNELQRRGFECELIERKTGANLDIEKIIKLIESSDCIVALLSTSYEYEKICQFEIVYGYKLGKVLLPIAVQAKYRPDYWLEEIFPRNRVAECKLATMKRDLLTLEKDIIALARIKPAQMARADINTSLLCQILWIAFKVSRVRSVFIYVCITRKFFVFWFRQGDCF